MNLNWGELNTSRRKFLQQTGVVLAAPFLQVDTSPMYQPVQIVVPANTGPIPFGDPRNPIVRLQADQNDFLLFQSLLTSELRSDVDPIFWNYLNGFNSLDLSLYKDLFKVSEVKRELGDDDKGYPIIGTSTYLDLRYPGTRTIHLPNNFSLDTVNIAAEVSFTKDRHGNILDDSLHSSITPLMRFVSEYNLDGPKISRTDRMLLAQQIFKTPVDRWEPDQSLNEYLLSGHSTRGNIEYEFYLYNDRRFSIYRSFSHSNP